MNQTLRPPFASAAALLAAFLATPATADEIPVTEYMKMVCAEAEKSFADQGGIKEPGKTTVLLYKYTFCPPNLTVTPGTTVRWVIVDKRTSHSIWLKEAGEPESPRIFNMESYEFTFAAPGKYPYICGPHWEQEKMIGHVTVIP
jgi:plastocyanin